MKENTHSFAILGDSTVASLKDARLKAESHVILFSSLPPLFVFAPSFSPPYYNEKPVEVSTF